jgi:hypothetical protein
MRAVQIVVGSAIALVLLTTAQRAAEAQPATFNIPGVGRIIAGPRVNPANGQRSMEALFTATNAAGNPIPLTTLEKTLAEDHLNWLNIVVTNRNPAPGFPATFVDPQLGGQGPFWADQIPWYYNETPPPANLPPGIIAPPSGQLSNNLGGLLNPPNPNSASVLHFGDAANANADFATFLVSDYDNPATWGAQGGPHTYSILGGFTWSVTAGAPPTFTAATFPATFTQAFRNQVLNFNGNGPNGQPLGWRQAAPPDTSSSPAGNPTWNARETASANALIIVQPTSGGQPINNANSSRVQYQQTVPAGQTSVVFQIPGIINGQRVSDATQWTKARSDAGAIQFAAFDTYGHMLPSLSAWLLANHYVAPNELDMPDFSLDPSTGTAAVYYGVNTAQLMSSGDSFVNSNPLGSVFTESQLMADLPGYMFSSTPLDYVPGVGWEGTPLPGGDLLDFNAFHQIDAVIEPDSLLVFGTGLVGVLVWQRRGRARSKRG